MTTSVTVDTHAGFPVEVRQIYFKNHEAYGDPIITIVSPQNKQTFYIHDELKIEVRELPFAKIDGAIDTPGISDVAERATD
jgi:hypothetical protein